MGITRKKNYENQAPGIGCDDIGFFAIHCHPDRIDCGDASWQRNMLVNVGSCYSFFKTVAEDKEATVERKAAALSAMEGDKTRLNHLKPKTACIIF